MSRLRLGLLLALLPLAGCTRVGAPVTSPPAPGLAGVEPAARVEPPSPEPTATHPGAAPGSPDGHALLRPVRAFPEVRGLWVVRSSMTSEQEVRDMVERAASAGFNTLIVQVRGRADAFYRSTLEPRAETLGGPAAFDPLALAIEEGHGRGMAVHAWVNTHLVWGPAARPRSPDHILNARPEWLAVPRELAGELRDMDPADPRFVEALRRYAERNGGTVEGIYTSPSHPAVQERVHAVWMDLLDRYDLDGIHFDYIRFPSGDFDYSRGALERFALWLDRARSATYGRGDAVLGIDGGSADLVAAGAGGALGLAGRGSTGTGARDALGLVDAYPEAWADFRREQITELVARIYRDVKARRPEVVVSAAVVADAEDAYSHRFQDWRRWLADGILDIAVPMAYTADDGRFTRQIGEAREAAGSARRTWAGIGAYLNGFDGTLAKIDIARAHDVGGLVLFSYDWAIGSEANGGRGPFLERIARDRFAP